MRRTLILDEDELVMVVGKDVVEQVDENRGEMNRTEFVNFLIQSQLKECSEKHNYVDKEEFDQSVQEIKELLRSFLEFFLSHGLAMGSRLQDKSLEEWNQKLEALDSDGEEVGKLKPDPE